MESRKTQSLKSLDRPKLHKVLADYGLCSRRKGEEWITEGIVTVNGEIARLGIRVDPERDLIRVRGKKLQLQPVAPITFMVNKPRGFTCSNEDEHAEKLIFDLLSKKHAKIRLFCAGRLDLESEGLVILTNNGSLSHRLTHPSHQAKKRYQVEINRRLDTVDLTKLTTGFEDEGEFLKLDQIRNKNRSPAGATKMEVCLGHGKKREIRRAFSKLGYRVKKLRRFSIGRLFLDKLPVGSYRILNNKEIDLLFGR